MIAGQGTIGLEIAEEAGPDLEAVVVPVGGGGLVSGIAAALAAVRPEVRVIGVEAEGAAAMRASVAAGHPVRLDAVDTIADGIAVKTPSELTLAHVEALVDEIVTVTDEEIGRALILLLERAKAVVEPAGVAGLAALLAGKVAGLGPGRRRALGRQRRPAHAPQAHRARPVRRRPVPASAADRRRPPGRPRQRSPRCWPSSASTSSTSSTTASASRCGIDQVELLLTLETRDPDHRLVAVDRLRADGHTVDLIA